MNKAFLTFLLKLCLTYLLFYCGLRGLMGVCTKGRYYSEWMELHGNLIAWYRTTLFRCSIGLLHHFGYTAVIESAYTLRIVGANAINLVWSCLGIGLISFWVAYIVANNESVVRKIVGIAVGIVLISLLNTIRIVVILIANNQHWAIFPYINHHELFNCCVYLLLVVGIYIHQLLLKLGSD